MIFQGKKVFITGGSKGLGKAMARRFVAEGANVAVNGRSQETLDILKEDLPEDRLLTFCADITDYQAMEDIAASVESTWGGVDVLVNNAGIVGPIVTAVKTKKEDFDRAVDINLKGTFYVSQIFGKKMIERKNGRIITMSTQIASFGDRGFFSYAVSKAALETMTRTLAYEWSQYGVTAVGIAPGFVAGGMNEGLMRKQPLVDFLSGKTPMGRMAAVDELVDLVVFLASPQARYINGETIVIDGGMTGYAREGLIDLISKGKS